MLALFKGELSYTEIMWGMPYSHLIYLRDARVEQLVKEKEAMEKEREKIERDKIRNTILTK